VFPTADAFAPPVPPAFVLVFPPLKAKTPEVTAEGAEFVPIFIQLLADELAPTAGT
jgi:hypothetical protein